MRKIGRILSVLLIVITMTSIYCCALRDGDRTDVVVSMTIGNPIMQVNGKNTEIDAGRGTGPVISSGRTLVPIRAIVEAFNGTVGWDDKSRTATLKMGGDTIKLTIGSKTAYLNGAAFGLDVVPVIINGRTMLPIRFVAEGFCLGVAWEQDTRRVTVVRNYIDDAEYDFLAKNLPAYDGKAYVNVNGGKPMFKNYEIISASFEYYSKLDHLKRCDVVMSSVSKDTMPTGERGNISSVKPTGWINASYDNVSGGYLYNRCHLIGWQLTGEDANERNLITGTRYLNIDGMLNFENKIDEYVERTGNHVMYRVTPYFKGNNLLADGVLLEAYSVEDSGKGISFCVYCYNVQPGIYIDYATGKSQKSDSGTAIQTNNSSQQSTNTAQGNVYRTPSGKKYHLSATCGGKNSYLVTLSQAIAAGLTPCAKCAA